MSKRADMSQLINMDDNDNDLDIDLGATMTSSADAKSKKEMATEDEIPDLSVVAPYYQKNYPLAYKKRFERLKKAGVKRGSHSAFVQEAVERYLSELESEYSQKIQK